jgi:hypothetical protein
MIEASPQKIKELLEIGDERSCIYACLELRLAIEKHVYGKIDFYTKRHGAKLLYSNWQPNKALKILCQLEPYADQSYELRFAKENKEEKASGVWKSLGKHEALNSKWVAKNYNKLGSYLHRIPGKELDLEELKNYLQEVLLEIERVAGSTLQSDFAETISFHCNLCKEKVICNSVALPNLSLVYCPNMKCNATFIPSIDKNKNWQFRLDSLEFKCQECDHENLVLPNELCVGARISCTGCNVKYQITNHTWNYSKINS